MNNHLATPFRFVPFIVASPPDRGREEYARSLLAAAGVDTVAIPAEPPVCVDAEAGLARLAPEIREALLAKRTELLANLDQQMIFEPDEVLVSSRLTALADEWGTLPEGMVVYDRVTNLAHVQFVMMHIQVGLKSGLFRMIGMPEPPAPAPPRHQIRAMVMLAPSQGLEITIGVASTLAWALPPPWGPLAAAGMTVVQSIYGQATKGPDVGELIVASGNAMSPHVDEIHIGSSAAALKSYTDWLNLQFAALNRLNSARDIDYDNWLPEVILKPLRSFLQPGGSVYKAVYDLQNFTEVQPDLGNEVNANRAWETYLLGVNLYLCGLKLILQLEAQCASFHHEKQPPDLEKYTQHTKAWLDDYSVFLTAIVGGKGSDAAASPGWIRRISDEVAAAIPRRLSFISQPTHTQYVEHSSGTSRGPSYYYEPGHWDWKDGPHPYSVDDKVPAGTCSDTHPLPVSREAEARAQWQQHYHDIQVEQDKKYAAARQSVQSWQSLIAEWNQHLPPRQPDKAPDVDPQGWTGSPPYRVIGWAEGNYVSYAVAFVNAAGPGPIGPYTVPEPIRPGVGASLKNFPTDPLAMAKQLQIYRRVATATGSPIITLAGIVELTAATWHDGVT